MEYDWLTRVKACLNSTEFAALSTHDKSAPWVNPVYFAWDAQFQFYFISEMNCRHMNNIAANNQAALAIYDSGQSTHDDVLGIQLYGKATILNHDADKQAAFATYFGRVYPDLKPQYGDAIDNPYAYDPAWHYVIIEPQEFYIFDTKYFGEKRTLVPLKEIIQ